MKNNDNLLVWRLKKEMKRAGINARELSERANLGRSFVYDILSGKSSNPTTRKISAIADVLGVSMLYLVNGTSNDNDVRQNSGTNFIEIQEADFKADKNGLCQISDKSPVTSHFFRRDWLQSRTSSSADNLKIAYIQDDIMHPSICCNDMVIVDISQKTPNPAGIFLVFDGAGAVAKRLEFFRHNNEVMLHVKSDNNIYCSYDCHPSEVDIIGRIVWISRSI